MCIDETWLTKKERSTGGFQGRSTAGTKTIVLGMMEINFESRRATGNCILMEIPDRSARTLKRFINTHVVPGSLIFTDSFKGYAWLSRPNSGFVHRCVNHKRREFSKTERIFGREVVVSTNSAEGLFGRLKSFLRAKGAKKVGKTSYGHLLSEFLWTAKCSAQKLDPFADLLEQIKFWQDQRPQREHFPISLKASIPPEVVQEFLSACQPPSGPNPAEPALTRLNNIPEHAPEHAAPEHAVEQASSNARNQACEPACEAACQPASSVLPLTRDNQSDSSDVELVLVRPAKRARPTVKIERLMQHVVAAKKEEVVKREEIPPTPFCPQGHDMILKPFGPRTVASKRKRGREVMEVQWERVTCDVCEAEVEQDTWRCEICNWGVCQKCAASQFAEPVGTEG